MANAHIQLLNHIVLQSADISAYISVDKVTT